MVVPRASMRVPMVQRQSSFESSDVWVPLTASDIRYQFSCWIHANIWHCPIVHRGVTFVS